MSDEAFDRRLILPIGLCGLVMFTDGFDTQAIGYVAPAIIQAFGVDRTTLAPVFAAGLFGLMLGDLAFGPIADRVGRKPVLVFCTIWFGVCSLMTMRAASVDALFYWRLLTGLGLGGAMPNAIAITADLAPRRMRSTIVMIMFCGFSIGAAVGGLVAAGILARYGWPAVFLAGGVSPLVVAVLLAAYLPSVRAGSSHDDHVGVPMWQLFQSGRAPMTLLIWLVFFMSLLDLYFVTNWLPTLINDSGVALERAVLITAMFQIGGTVGTLTLGRLFDRLPPFRVLAGTYFTAAMLVASIGVAGTSVPVLFITVFGAGFCIVGGQTGANALTASAYPGAIRATGVGWALGVGRVGSIVGPLIGGLLLSLEWETRELFLVGGIPGLVAATSAFAIDRWRLAGRS